MSVTRDRAGLDGGSGNGKGTGVIAFATSRKGETDFAGTSTGRGVMALRGTTVAVSGSGVADLLGRTEAALFPFLPGFAGLAWYGLTWENVPASALAFHCSSI